MIKNIFKLKNLYTLIAISALAYGGYYFGLQNTDSTTNNKTLELTTVDKPTAKFLKLLLLEWSHTFQRKEQ
jgi:hypothetical protein